MSSHPLTDEAAALALTLPAGPLEITQLGMWPLEFLTTCAAIEAFLGLPPAITLVPTRVPRVLLADRPLEIECSVVDVVPGSHAAESVTRSISTHAQLLVASESNGGPRTIWCTQIALHPSTVSGGGWIARVLVRPASWAAASSVTLLSLTFAGRPLPCDSGLLPATLRVGYNHAPAPAGAVFAAAVAGDVRALQAALDEGGSTEETDAVRGAEGGGLWSLSTLLLRL